VNIVQAALGAEVDAPTVDGTQKVTVKPGTQHGDVIKLKGKGVPILHTNGRRGDQLIVVKVVVPERLNDKQRKLLKELGDSLGLESLGKDNRNLFERFMDAVGDALGS
jgi:molecular chaperone DnaJ